MSTRRIGRLVTVIALAVVFVIASASAASAHAVLQNSNPPAGGEIDKSPPQITLTYNEAVEVSGGSIRLFTCTGRAIAVGLPHHPGGVGHTVAVPIPDLAPGVYIVNWRVISADSHPVQSTFSFRVGQGVAASVNGCASTATKVAGPSTTVRGLFAFARFLLFAGLALMIGAAVYLVVIVRDEGSSARVRRLVWIGWAVTLVASIAGLMLQAPNAAGGALGDAFKWSLVSDVISTRYGRVAEARVLFLIAALPLLLSMRVLDKQRRPWSWIIPAGIIGVGIAATPAMAGHASTGDHTWLAVPLDTTHVVAMSIWMGGLVALAVTALGAVRPRGSLRHDLTLFSKIAFGCVLVIVATGLFASWREVGLTAEGYTRPYYGRLLLVKVGLVIVVVALAAVSRSVVRKRQQVPDDAPESVSMAMEERNVKELRRSIGGEVLFGIAVLAVTAFLVNAPPARTVLESKLYAKTQTAGTGADALSITVTMDPAAVGSNNLHVYTNTLKGEDLAVRNISAAMTLPAQNVTVPADLRRGGASHFLTSGLILPEKGKWRLVVHVLRGQFGDTATVFDVPIR